MNAEIWKPVVGYEERYLISSLGRVWSIKKAIFLRPGIASHGYPTVSLKRKTYCVHSLVAEAFIGPRPANHEVRHMDGRRSNPRLDNLCYGTRRQNQLDKLRHGKRKLTQAQVEEIRALKGQMSSIAAAANYPVCDRVIRYIWRGEQYAEGLS